MAVILTGRVFHDLNHSGQYEPADPGIPNAYVVLCRDPLFAVTQTGPDGVYRFSITEAGDYQLYETGAAVPNACPPASFSQPSGFDASNGPRKRTVTIAPAQIAAQATVEGPDFSHDALFSALDCGSRMIQFVGRPTEWVCIDLVTGQATPQGQLQPLSDVNAVGYNPLDDYLYGYDQTSNQLVRVGSDGQVVRLGLPTGLPAAAYNVGTVDISGFLYLYAAGAPRFYVVDLRPDSMTFGLLVDPARGFAEQTGDTGKPLSRPLAIGDWAESLRDGYLYGVEPDGTVVRVSPVTGEVSALQTSGPNPGAAFGAVAMDQTGALYAVSNADGTVFRYLIDGGAARGLRFSSTVYSDFSDGAICPYAQILLDFGDAPDAGGGGGSGNYSTRLSSDGPRHALVSPLYLGTQVTDETDAHVNATATGDDLTRGIRDDGLSEPLPALPVSALAHTLYVAVSNYTGLPANLYGWIDFNRNGFFELSEAAEAVVPAGGGVQTIPLTFAVPAGVTLQPGYTFVRLRLTTAELAPGADPRQDGRSVGPAPDGEVEDYLLRIAAVSDLRVEKTADRPVLHPGETITYTIFVSNAGPDGARRALLEDAVPEELTNPAYSLDGGSTWLPWTGSLHLGDLDAGGSATVLLRADFTGLSVTGEVIGTAVVSSTSEDGFPDNNSSTVVTPVNASADLEVSKRVEPVPAIRDQPLTYILTVINHGPDTAQAATLVDIVPVALREPEVSLDGGATWSPWQGLAELGDVPAGTVLEILVRGMVDPSAPDVLHNAVQVYSATPDPHPGSNEACLDTPVEPSADLSLYKSAGPDPVFEGKEVLYTLFAVNAGPSAAENTVVTDPLPPQLENPEYSLNGASWLPWDGALTLGRLEPGEAREVLVRGTVAPGTSGVLTNTAVVSSGTPDPDEGNNTSTAAVTAVEAASVASETPDPDGENNTDRVVTPVADTADLSVSKTADWDPAVPGEYLTYTLTVYNAGPAAASNVRVADDAPGLLNQQISLDGGQTWLPWAGAVTVSSLAAGGRLVLRLRGTVDPTAAGALINTATALSDTPDPDPDNNTDTIFTETAPSADLAIAERVSPETAVPGEAVTYIVTVVNHGPSAAVNAVVADMVPGVVSGVTYSADGGLSWQPWSGAYAAGTIPAGGRIGLLLRGTLSPAAAGTLANTAVVSSATPDPNPLDNSASVTAPIRSSADLSVIKLARPDPAIPGQPVVHRLLVSNAGPSAAENVTLFDPVPDASYSLDGGASWRPWPGSLNLGGLEAGGHILVLVRSRVDPMASGSLINTASVTADTPDPRPENNEYTAETPLIATVDLSVAKTANPSPALPGQPLTYTLTVSNAGPAVARLVTLTDALPGADYSLDGTVWQPWAGSYDVGDVYEGADFTLYLRTTVPADAAGELTNTASVTTATPDRNPDNNTVTLVTPITGSADLAIIKTASPSPAIPGQYLVYTLTVYNAGPSTAVRTVLTDALPGAEYSLDGTAWRPWDGYYAAGELLAGQSASLYLRVPVPADASGRLTNTASVSSLTPDPDLENNTVTRVTPVMAAADLEMAKTAYPDPARTCEFLVYTLTVTNHGPAYAENVLVTDAVPQALCQVQVSDDWGDSWHPWRGVYRLGRLAPGASFRLLIAGTVSRCACGPLTNTAEVGASTLDPNPDNNVATVVTPVLRCCSPRDGESEE